MTEYEMRISNWSSDVCSSDLDRADEQREVAVLDRVEHPLLEIEHHLRVRVVVEQRDQEIAAKGKRARLRIGDEAQRLDRLLHRQPGLFGDEFGSVDDAADRLFRNPGRSEEHTSELQSLMRHSYAVFCLKKN